MSMVAESSAPVIPTGTWSIDPSWSSLEFEVRKLGLVTIKGRVPGFSGTIHGGESLAIDGVVDATSITTFDADRDAHLQSPEFFDTQRYPELRFRLDVGRARRRRSRGQRRPHHQGRDEARRAPR